MHRMQIKYPRLSYMEVKNCYILYFVILEVNKPVIAVDCLGMCIVLELNSTLECIVDHLWSTTSSN